MSNSEPLFIIEGRGFTLYELKRSLIGACGGKLNDVYLSFRERPVWEAIEAIEIVSELNRVDTDIWDMLT